MINEPMKIQYGVHAYTRSSHDGAQVSLSDEPPKVHDAIEQFVAGLGDLEVKIDREKSTQVFPESKTEMPFGKWPEAPVNPIAYVLVKAYDPKRDFNLTMRVSNFSDTLHDNEARAAPLRRITTALGVKCEMEFEGTYEQAVVLERIGELFKSVYDPKPDSPPGDGKSVETDEKRPIGDNIELL